MLVAITAIYCIVTAAYVVISRLEWTVLKDALDESRRANALTLRAWVLAERVEVPSFDFETAILIKTRNYGKLPATGAARQYEFLLRGAPLPFNPPGNPDARAMGLIPAGGEHAFAVHLPNMPDDQLARIARGEEGVLMLTARITYTDALKTRGDSTYCWFFVPGTPTEPAHFVEFPLPKYGVR